MNIFRGILAFFFDLIEVLVVALAIFVVCYLFLFQPHQVNGSSMEPNFHNIEYLLTDKLSYRFNKPKRGDVIVFRAPKNRELDYIKRIIALPGEQIKILDNRVYINDQLLKEDYLDPSLLTYPGAFLKNGVNLLVPEDEYVAFGDNRPHSSDSREWGAIPKDDIIGKAWLRYWPLSRLGFISHQ